MLTFIRSLFFALFFIPFLVQAKNTEVTLSGYDVRLTYPESVRLNQVLTDTTDYIQSNSRVVPYWAGAQLLESAKNEHIDNLKEKVLEKLRYLSSTHPESNSKVNRISGLLRTQSFTYRHYVSLDNDLVRIQPERNPVLGGSYSLIVPQRPNIIYVVGTTESITDVKFKSHTKPDKYLSLVNLPENSDTDTLFVIQPDGTLSEVSSTYWNNQPVFFAPGAIIFVGFKNLPNRFSRLNQEIAELLRYMRPPGSGDLLQ